MDYTIDLDTGVQDAGPYLTWHAAPTRDGAHGAGTWSVKDNAGRASVNLADGFVFDWPASITGWVQEGGVPGVAPRKQWNVTHAKFEPRPGDDYKRAMHAPIAYLLNGTPTLAVWEQNSAAAWRGFCDLMALIKARAPSELPKLPLVSFTGYKEMKVGNGVTLVPTFEVLRFVRRPTCLPGEDAMAPASDDTWSAPASSSARTTPSAGSLTPGGNGAVEPAHTAGADPWPTGTAAGSEPLIDDEMPW